MNACQSKAKGALHAWSSLDIDAIALTFPMSDKSKLHLAKILRHCGERYEDQWLRCIYGRQKKGTTLFPLRQKSCYIVVVLQWEEYQELLKLCAKQDIPGGFSGSARGSVLAIFDGLLLVRGFWEVSRQC